MHRVLDRFASDLESLDQDSLKDALRSWISQIELTPPRGPSGCITG